jgi:polyphosphate kinase
VDECLVAYLNDGVDAWDLQSDGTYVRVGTVKKASRRRRAAQGAQASLMARYAGGNPELDAR